MIDIHQLSYAYGNRTVLKDIQLHFPTGQFSVLLGRNGCGKSTLFKLMAGLLPLQTGQVSYQQQALGTYKGKQRAELLGFLPQFHKTVFPFSVRDVVITGRAAFSRFQPTQADWQRVEYALQDLDITHLADKPYTDLSGGERQLVMIARILVQQPKVILLDEPTNHLDVYYQSYLMEKLKALSGKDMTVIAIMHDPNLALLYADQLFFMKEHEMIQPHAHERVDDPAFLARVYGIEFDQAKVGQRHIVMPAQRTFSN